MTTLIRLSGMLILTLLSTLVAARAQAQDAGAAVYATQKCSLCHSLGGRGNAKGPLDEVGSKLTADDIRKWIVAPAEIGAKSTSTRKPAMRAYPNLPKDDLDALVTYMAAQKKK
jgi:mono/diheme cytochrome c family protein